MLHFSESYTSGGISHCSGTLVRKDNTLRFINQNDEKKDIPIERYSDIYIFGEVTVNSALLNILSQYGINIHFFNYYSFYTGSFYSREQLLAGQLLVKQAEHYSDCGRIIEGTPFEKGLSLKLPS